MVYIAWLVCGVLTGMVIAGILWRTLCGGMIKAMKALLRAINYWMRQKNAAQKASKELGVLIAEFEQQTKRTNESPRLGKDSR